MSERPEQRPSKREAFLAFLQEGWVSIHLDARRPGVRVPQHLRAEPRLVLQYGRDMPVPIPDLKVTEAGVQATLSFSRTPHETVVPWSAVYIIACTDGRGVLYQEDIPQELLALVQATEDEGGAAQPSEPAEAAEDAPAAAPERPSRTLRSVSLDEVPEGEAPASDGADKRPRRRRPTLRVVK